MRVTDPALEPIREKVQAGRRLTVEDGMACFASTDLLGLGALANQVRERLSGDKTYYVINTHLNYSNVCVATCTFCAFGRKPGQAGGYTMQLPEVWDRFQFQEDPDKTREIHVVGGLHPELPFDYYVQLIAGLKERWPRVHVKAFTAVEIAFLAKLADLTVEQVLREFQAVGLDSLPGGGAEIFHPEVRHRICDDKSNAEEWLEVHRIAHGLGIPSNATMLYGHVETPEHRVDHLLRLRALQDETGGFLTFIPLAFHPAHTGLAHLPGPTGIDDLRVHAVARLLLDNFPHVKAYWIMTGPKMAQVLQNFGVDDLDGTVEEEEIVHDAGATSPEYLAERDLVRLIQDAGRVPVERDSLYNEISV